MLVIAADALKIQMGRNDPKFYVYLQFKQPTFWVEMVNH